MLNRNTEADLIRGEAPHRRTESDYMSVMLDAVTLEDWQDVVNKSQGLAKGGDPAARAWLSRYLVGKPEAKAPSPLAVIATS